MKYVVVNAKCFESERLDILNKMELKINELCNDGWKPQGGISISATNDSTYVIAQAMIKE